MGLILKKAHVYPDIREDVRQLPDRRHSSLRVKTELEAFRKCNNLVVRSTWTELFLLDLIDSLTQRPTRQSGIGTSTSPEVIYEYATN